MNLFFIIFTVLFFQTKSAVPNCIRFCVIHLTWNLYQFNNNLLHLNLQHCSHLILDAYSDDEINQELLRKVWISLQKSKNILPNLKILIYVAYDDENFNKSINNPLLKVYKKFDGFYFDWRDEFFRAQSYCWESESSPEEIRKCLTKILTEFRQAFPNKIIVTTVGPENVERGYYDFKIFNENIDYISLEPEQQMQHVHMQNFFAAKQFSAGKNGAMGNLANIFLNNGIPKNKLLIYVNGPDIVVEPRVRVIWSSLNHFPGILIDKMQFFNNPLYDGNQINDDISKLEILHICPTNNDMVIKGGKNLTCYYSLKNGDKNYSKISKEKYQKCDRIIFHKLTSNYSTHIDAESLQKIIHFFKGLNLTKTSLILSFEIDYNLTRKIWKGTDNFEIFEEITASNIKDFVESYDLDGIELICAESLTTENLHKIITNIKSKISKKIEIGLQVNVFEVSSDLVDLMKNVTWVTHKINPLSDVALVIFYQWNDLYEKYDLDLQKVIIKFSPAIWQQPAIFSFPGKADTKERENPEDDVILNRKYLCLNETIKQNLPAANNYLNLPIIFSIRESYEKMEERIQKNAKDPHLAMAVLTFQGFGKPLPQDLYYLRHDTKEILEYKIKIAHRHGFGGFAIASINDDDIEEICGTSMFEVLIILIK